MERWLNKLASDEYWEPFMVGSLVFIVWVATSGLFWAALILALALSEIAFYGLLLGLWAGTVYAFYRTFKKEEERENINA